jgi:tetratricopeptide (TPR) repeat protein
MSSLFFWRNWNTTYRRTWFVTSGIFIVSLLLMWFSYWQGTEGVIHWERIQEQKTIETTVHSFRLGPFELAVPGESYVIFEFLQGSDLEHNVIASYIFLGVFMFSVMVLLSVITVLERFWYFAGMSLFILFVVSLRLDVLLLFGQQGIIVPAFVLLLFLTLSFYFKSIRPLTSFGTRIVSFSVLTLLFWGIILRYAEIPFPTLHLAVTSYVPALILSILFIVMVAHEILVSFVSITSQGGTKSLRHFLVISLIYMVNVFITCLHEMGTIDWNFIYIDLYLLLTLSGILGLWGFKLREPLYDNILPFSPFGAFFYMGLGTICFITLSQLLGNANDATLKVIRDLIIFSHVGFGLIFLAYIFSNFMTMMADNLSVHKILYRPTRMPYFTFRFAGIIVTLAFVFVSYWRDYVNHSVAGFYNYVADLHLMQGNETFARGFYERSRANAFQNHRANYALAMMKASRFDFAEAEKNFELANGKRPSDFSLVNSGNIHLWRKSYFPAIHIYREASKKKSSPVLSNNLGFSYARVHNLDSAVYFISEARNHPLTKSSAETNFFALVTSEYLPVKTDSILKIFDTESPSVLSNALAASTLFKQDFKTNIDPLPEKELDLYSATLLNNYIIRNARTLDTAFTAKAFKVADDSLNFSFSEALKSSLAYAYYHQGNIQKALEIMAELSYISQSYQGKYNYIQGLWALEQGSPDNANSYFNFSVAADYKQARLYNAIALSEAGRLQEAWIAWDSVAIYGQEAEKQMALRMKRILALNPSEALELNDIEKYQYSRYIVSINDTVYFSRLINTFDSENYKAQALLDMAGKQFKSDRIVSAIRFYSEISGLRLTDKDLYDKVRHFELQMLASRGEIRKLAQQINKDITFDASRALEKMLYTALISEASGDVEKARSLYKILGTWNPYFENGILTAANFYRSQDQKSSQAYNILAEAIQVNGSSLRLLKAYAGEAARQGMDEYASSAAQRIAELEERNR